MRADDKNIASKRQQMKTSVTATLLEAAREESEQILALAEEARQYLESDLVADTRFPLEAKIFFKLQAGLEVDPKVEAHLWFAWANQALGGIGKHIPREVRQVVAREICEATVADLQHPEVVEAFTQGLTVTASLPDYLVDLGTTLLADSVASETGEKESGFDHLHDLFYAPQADIVELFKGVAQEYGLDPADYVDEVMLKDVEKKVNDAWAGKVTLEDLYNEHPVAAHRLIMQAVGHGVSHTDDAEPVAWLESKGVDPDIDLGYHESPYDGAWRFLSDLEAKMDGPGAEAVTEAITTYPKEQILKEMEVDGVKYHLLKVQDQSNKEMFVATEDEFFVEYPLLLQGGKVAWDRPERFPAQVIKEFEKEILKNKKILSGSAPAEEIHTEPMQAEETTAASDDEFIDYVMSFYGPQGIYGKKFFGKGVTEQEVEKALQLRKAVTTPAFEGDSVDREWVRDIMLQLRGHTDTEHDVSVFLK